MKKILITLFLCVFNILAFSQENACIDKLIRNVDEFTDEVSIETPHYIKPNITKVILKNGKTEYYLYLSLHDSYCTVSGSGLTILFTDGTKFNKPNVSVDCDYYGGDEYTYSSFVKLMQNEVITFSQKQIKKYKLYIFDENMPEHNAIDFMGMVECLIKSK